MTTTSATRLLVRSSPWWGAATVVGALGQASLTVATPPTPAWSAPTVATAAASGLLVAVVLTVAAGSLARSAGTRPRWGLVAASGVLAVLVVAGLTVLTPAAGVVGVLAVAAFLPRAAGARRVRPGSRAGRTVSALASLALTAVLLAVTVLASALLGLLVTGAPAAGLSSLVAGGCAAAALARWTAWSLD